jgi:outer membrane protein assembly factor BamB
VVSQSRNPISWVVIATISLAATTVWGQQPNRKPEPYVAALLPGEQRWLVTLPALPSAGGAMDASQVYVPLQDGSLTALDRETGLARWTVKIETALLPVAVGGLVFAVSGEEVHALDPAAGERRWSAPLPGRVRGPLLVRGNLILALTEPDQLVALRIDTREAAWRVPTGPGNVLMNADERAVYLTTPDSRVLSVRLADGAVAWQRTLSGTLSEPAVSADRVLIGSTTDSLWALDPKSGSEKWVWARRAFGGDVIGAAISGKVAYVASKDNVIRALNLGNGHQLWRQDVKTRPLLPPRAFFGTVAVFGLSPRVSTFLAKGGAAVATWAPPPPSDTELEGPPLIDEHFKPFRVAMVVVMRDGRVAGIRPTQMTFPEAPAGRFAALPGRPLPRERLPGEPEPPPASPLVPTASGAASQ